LYKVALEHLASTLIYDGDTQRVRCGNRVKSTINGVMTAFIGNWSEWSAGSTTNYYYAGNQRVAMRTDNALYYFLGDHLGSTSITTNASGGLVSEMRYKPWGETRYTSGTTPTNYTYTGQYSNMGDFGLMFYNARWYDPSLGRFAQADTIIPGGVQGLDRYAYAINNPIRYNDPSGHIPKEEICKYMGVCGKNAEKEFEKQYGAELHDLLWDTTVTWGDTLEWRSNGKKQAAVLVLFTTNGSDLFGMLWGIEGENVGSPIPFSAPAGADRDEYGESTLKYNPSIKKKSSADLPLSFPAPQDIFDDINTPYMNPQDRTNYPEGTIILFILSIPATVASDGTLPLAVTTGSKVLGYVDALLTTIGITQPEMPYWFNDLFGSPVKYPLVCWASFSSGSC